MKGNDPTKPWQVSDTAEVSTSDGPPKPPSRMPVSMKRETRGSSGLVSSSGGDPSEYSAVLAEHPDDEE